MKDFREYKVWEKSHGLALSVYRATGAFPRDELFGLTSQLRRACASIPANIAEGCGRGSNKDFARFLQIAMGSASELEYHLVLARDLNILRAPDFAELTARTTEVKRMLTALLQKVKAAPSIKN
ncbi:MAG TPA: four helix bundle protein [Pyrinomonadaceae bacterium]|nr:four helix bundle protein [Pyrinomonadaceae bacterium]